jgi:hypothetical protein
MFEHSFKYYQPPNNYTVPGVLNKILHLLAMGLVTISCRSIRWNGLKTTHNKK